MCVCITHSSCRRSRHRLVFVSVGFDFMYHIVTKRKPEFCSIEFKSNGMFSVIILLVIWEVGGFWWIFGTSSIILHFICFCFCLIFFISKIMLVFMFALIVLCFYFVCACIALVHFEVNPKAEKFTMITWFRIKFDHDYLLSICNQLFQNNILNQNILFAFLIYYEYKSIIKWASNLVIKRK